MSQSKHRTCPVFGKTITSRDCAESRGPDFGCPGECEFNPWGHPAFPEPFLGMEAKLKEWAFEKLEMSLGRNWEARRPGAYKVSPHEDFCEMIHAIHVGDGSRPSPLGRWLGERPKELRRDERVLAGCQDQAMPMLLEVHRVLDDTGMECVDLLEPERPPFILRDAGMAHRVCRFQLLFGWTYHTPWFSRALGLLTPMPWPTNHAPAEIIAVLARARGWKPDASGPGLREWLRQNVAAMGESLEAWQELNRRALLQNSRIIQTCLQYKPREKPEKIAAVLQRAMSVQMADAEPEHRADGFSVAMDVLGEYHANVGGHVVLGLLLLGKNKAQFEGYQCPEFDDAAARLEKAAGAALKRVRRSELDLSTRALEGKPDVPGQEFVPDEIINRTAKPRIQTFVYHQNPDTARATPAEPAADFASREIAALGGLTPLAAATRPDLRQTLVNLVKSHIHDIDRQRAHGAAAATADFGPMLREIGLPELDFPPPPVDQKMEDLLLSDDDENDYYDEDEDDVSFMDFAGGDPDVDAALDAIRGLDSAGLPPVPLRLVMDFPTAYRRCDEAIRRYADGGKLVDMVGKYWEDLFGQIVTPLIANGMEEESPEFALCAIHFGLMAHVMIPKPKKPVSYDKERVLRAMTGYTMELRKLLKRANDDDLPEVMEELAGLSPQPALALVIIKRCLRFIDEVGAKGEPQFEWDSMPLIAIGLLAALWEMNYVGGQ